MPRLDRSAVNKGPTISQRITSFDASILSELEDEFRDQEFYLTLASPAGYPAIEALSTAAPDEVAIPLSQQTIEWLVDKNPQGQGFLVLARATANAQIIGRFLFYAKEMVVRELLGGEAAPLIAYLCVHLFVAPRNCRHGLFERMTAFGIDLLLRAGVRFVYTVPNARSAPGFLNSAWRVSARSRFELAWRASGRCRQCANGRQNRSNGEARSMINSWQR